MVILALDLSTKTGYAVLKKETNHIKLLAYGTVYLPKGRVEDYGEHPFGYIDAVEDLTKVLVPLWDRKIDAIVIEQTNKGRNRWSQKLLEWIHFSVLKEIRKTKLPIYYIDTSKWRSILGLKLTKEDRANNKLTKAQKTALGIKGKVTSKHLALAYVNNTYKLNLKMKHNDVADAASLGTAWLIKQS